MASSVTTTFPPTQSRSSEGTVVIVEDDRLIAEDLKAMCEAAGMRVLELIGRAQNAVDRICALSPSHVLMDIRLGGPCDGIDIARDVRACAAGSKVIFVTASNEPSNIARIARNGPCPVLVKPITEGELHAALAS